MSFFRKHILAPAIVGSAIGLATVFLISKAEAQQNPVQEYCNILAGYAEAVAVDRDNGTLLFEALEVAGQVEHPGFRSDAIWLVQYVHAPARLTPNEAAHGAFILCWEAYGEGA